MVIAFLNSIGAKKIRSNFTKHNDSTCACTKKSKLIIYKNHEQLFIMNPFTPKLRSFLFDQLWLLTRHPHTELAIFLNICYIGITQIKSDYNIRNSIQFANKFKT